MSKYSPNDCYIDPCSGILKNRLGITDEGYLNSVESDFAAARSFELAQNPIEGEFKVETLNEIHRRLFGDVYEWPGTFRTVDISKDETRFASYRYIASLLQEVFAKLRQENFLLGSDPGLFSQRAAYYMGELNAIHPFREGNGRAQREFLSQLAYRKGWVIHWYKISSEAILEATIKSFHKDYEALSNIIVENLESQDS